MSQESKTDNGGYCYRSRWLILVTHAFGFVVLATAAIYRILLFFKPIVLSTKEWDIAVWGALGFAFLGLAFVWAKVGLRKGRIGKPKTQDQLETKRQKYFAAGLPVLVTSVAFYLLFSSHALEIERNRSALFLKHIGVWFAMYADENGGSYPNDLTGISPDYLPVTNRLAMHSERDITLEDVKNGNTDFVYYGELRYQYNSNQVLMHTRRGLLGGYIAVLIVDGRTLRTLLCRDTELSLVKTGKTGGPSTRLGEPANRQLARSKDSSRTLGSESEPKKEQ